MVNDAWKFFANDAYRNIVGPLAPLRSVPESGANIFQNRAVRSRTCQSPERSQSSESLTFTAGSAPSRKRHSEFSPLSVRNDRAEASTTIQAFIYSRMVLLCFAYDWSYRRQPIPPGKQLSGADNSNGKPIGSVLLSHTKKNAPEVRKLQKRHGIVLVD